ncbi:MAG TPA: ABC transporter substrate-binding protein [Bacteroidales bacterium]|nr:ABC transporter substrate-binding protein [Bacteroidales bacterium]HSA42271.1 ABC transporter substrate-binding protein [Bacteroidales bacterium]
MKLIRPIWKPLLLLLGISALLLLLDLRDRKKPGPERFLNIALVQYSDSPLSEMTRAGIVDGLADLKSETGLDYILLEKNAQGDVGTLNLIFDAIKSQKPDLVFVTSTPTLQAAVKKIKQIPVVFTTVADPIVAGAGKTFSDHLPNITGISTKGDYDGMAALLAEVFPGIQTAGTLFTPGEANSLANLLHLEEALTVRGITLLGVPVNASSEISEAARSLMARNPQVVCQIIDNLTSLSFGSIILAGDRADIPLLGFVSDQAEKGAVITLARDYHQAGLDAVQLARRILQGEYPSAIPFRYVSKTILIINEEAALKHGVRIPEKVLARADKIIRKKQH